MVESALALAGEDWAVFPVRPRGKEPLVARGFKAATTDPETITAWWQKSPEANIGLAPSEGIFVLDVDPRHGGDESLGRLEAAHGPLPKTLTVVTGGGGQHRYFAAENPVRQDGVGNLLGPGLDTRVAGRGYVVAPPSVHPSGARYEWADPSMPIAEAPDWLIDLLQVEPDRPPRTVRPPVGSETDLLPGDDFNRRGDPRPLLEKAGWRSVRERSGVEEWRRPGADKSDGHSATLGFVGPNVLHVFSSAPEVAPFEEGKTYSPFAIVALLDHGGDFKAAASALRRRGYGEPSRNGSTPALITSAPPAPPSWETERKWPDPPARQAFHGLAGEVVRALAPHSEADAVAILAQFLVAVGSAIGAGPYSLVGMTKHHTNLFCVLVGETGKGRKGTSLGLALAPVVETDAHWGDKCRANGLSTGEGLIHRVRDPLTKQAKTGPVVVDDGVTDKRLLVIESEFARPLQAATREANTLTMVLRQAWDGDPLEVMTKTNPARATGAHVSMIGHITSAELAKLMGRTDAMNGFGNRFLWLAVARSQLLPKGGAPSPDEVAVLVKKTRAVLDFARKVGEVRWDLEADELWRQVYPVLSEGRPGLLGAVLGRGDAQVLRLAMLYALLNCCSVVSSDHLEAALALWEYCERSAVWVFGESTGDPVADLLLEELRSVYPDYLSRTELRNFVHRNQSIRSPLALLEKEGLAHPEVTRMGGVGRPPEHWKAVPNPPVRRVWASISPSSPAQKDAELS
jgi:hypothetical protein